MARVSISSWLFPVEVCTDNKERRNYLSITRFLWAILYILIFVSDLVLRFLNTLLFFHSFTTSGNTTCFPVSLVFSLSCIKGMFGRPSVSYHVQLPQNKEASREKTRFDSEWMNLRRIPSTVKKPSLSAHSTHVNTTGNSCRFAGGYLDSSVKIGPISGNLFIVLVQELETAL